MKLEALDACVRLSAQGTSTVMMLRQALDVCDRMSGEDLNRAVIWLTPPVQIEHGGPDVIVLAADEFLPLIARMRT